MILSLREPELAKRDEALCARYGLVCVAAPVAAPKAVLSDSAVADKAQAFIITSQQAAAYLPSQGTDRVVYAVGPRSASAARARGYKTVISGPGNGADLAKMMRGRSLEASLCWLRGEVIAYDIKAALADIVTIDEMICYQMVRADHLPAKVVDLLAMGQIKAVMALSSSQLVYFDELLHDHDLWQARNQIDILALSPTIARQARESGWPYVYQARRMRAVSVRALAVCSYRMKDADVR